MSINQTEEVVEPEVDAGPEDVVEKADSEPASVEAEDDAGRNPGREAAKYRRQLRDVETERDGLRTQLEALRRAEVERQVSATNVKPAALWASGADLDTLLAEDGTVDAAKVAEAIQTARDVLGIGPLPSAPSAEGLGNVGVPVGSGKTAPTWDQVLRSPGA